MNNKGVTLVELIIVIVIIGIISAFAVPAVGRYLENAQKSAVLEDARQFRNAADSYCNLQGGCADEEEVSYATISGYLSNFSNGDYTSMTATWHDGDNAWEVELVADAAGDWEYITPTGQGETYTDPADATNDNVTAHPTN